VKKLCNCSFNYLKEKLGKNINLCIEQSSVNVKVKEERPEAGPMSLKHVQNHV
jgi:hypothetical protein